MKNSGSHKGHELRLPPRTDENEFVHALGVDEPMRIEAPTYEVKTSNSAEKLLKDYGNLVSAIDTISMTLSLVTLVYPPPGLIVSRVGYHGKWRLALRLKEDQPFFMEADIQEKRASHIDLETFLACPKCGKSMVYLEKSVRICLAGHHCSISNDGKTAEFTGKQTKTAYKLQTSEGK